MYLKNDLCQYILFVFSLFMCLLFFLFVCPYSSSFSASSLLLLLFFVSSHLSLYEVLSSSSGKGFCSKKHPRKDGHQEAVQVVQHRLTIGFIRNAQSQLLWSTVVDQVAAA